MNPKSSLWPLALCCAWLASADAQQDAEPSSASAARPTVNLEELVERVGAAADKRFLLDRRTPTEVYAGGVAPPEISYPVLLSILRSNGLAAVEVEGIVNVVQASDVRSYPLPIVTPEAAGIAGEEWVTAILATTHVPAAELVPILRVLIPTNGHLAAVRQDLIVVDRFANLRRIAALVRELDSAPARAP